MNRLAIALTISAALASTLAHADAPDLSKVNGSLTTEAGKAYGDIDTVNGSISIEEKTVAQTVETVNGSIGVVASHVGGDVQTVRGDITIGLDSHVSGGVRVEKATGFFNTDRKRPPRIIIGPNAVVEGPLVFERPVTLHVHKSARTGPVTGATAQGFDGDSAPKD